MMIVKGVIVQIIKWEKKGDYFDIKDDNVEPHDLIRIGNITTEKSLVKRLIDAWKTLATIDDFPLNQVIGIWVKRPHDYKEKDIVAVSINVTKPEVIKHE